MYYVLSVGTNIGNKSDNINNCIDAINRIPYTDVISSSAVYETTPIGYAKQDDFYNCCLLVSSDFEPNEMLGICMGIEGALGRKRSIKNGPRIIDIDIIFAENRNISTKNLTVPHPRFAQRRFVLEPLTDIFIDGTAFGIDFKQYLDDVHYQQIKQVQYNKKA